MHVDVNPIGIASFSQQRLCLCNILRAFQISAILVVGFNWRVASHNGPTTIDQINNFLPVGRQTNRFAHPRVSERLNICAKHQSTPVSSRDHLHVILIRTIQQHALLRRDIAIHIGLTTQESLNAGLTFGNRYNFHPRQFWRTFIIIKVGDQNSCAVSLVFFNLKGSGSNAGFPNHIAGPIRNNPHPVIHQL